MSTYCLVLVILVSSLAILDAHKLSGNEWNTRIVNGEPIQIERLPWQISLHINGTHWCGGSIFRSDIIITAAHCLTLWPVGMYKVRAGSRNLHTGGQLVKVADVKIHERFINATKGNDIAVMRLAKPLKLGDSVKKITLAKKSPEFGAEAFVSGWGTLKFNTTKYPESLRGAQINIVDCALSKYNQTDITDNMICAGGDVKDSCQNDSGGPLVSNGELVGVVSWGTGCATPGFPGVYANVAYFQDWVWNAIEELKNK